MAKLTAEILLSTLRRHVGHSLRCVRETPEVAGFSMEAVAIRCDDCGEVVIEAVDTTQSRGRGPRPGRARSSRVS